MQSTDVSPSPTGPPAPAGLAGRSGGEARPGGRWLAPARIVGVALAVVTLALDAVSIPVMYHLAQTVCSSASAAACNPQLSSFSLLTPGQVDQLHAIGLSLRFYAIYVVGQYTLTTLVYAAPAALIFWRRPNDPMALFAAFMLVLFGGAAFNGTMQALPLVNPVWTFPTLLLNAIGQIAIYVFYCIFPSGRFVPRWTRWAALVYALVWAVQLAPLGSLTALAQAVTNGPLFLVVIGLVVVAQIYRYRQVSTQAERQETKWVVFGFVVGTGGFIVVLLIGNFALNNGQLYSVVGQLVFNTIVYLLLLLIPVTIAVAILRSRLWDIDVLIRRTLIYGSLTVVLAAVYFTVVLGAQALVRALTGQTGQQPVFIVASTLLIAALFQPLRQRFQGVIDRRFYRRKYDAARTLTAFGTTLRTETDLETLSAELVAVVRETMHPAHTSLWLLPRGRAAPDSEPRWDPREQG